MPIDGGDDDDQPIAEYVGRLIDDAKAYAKAEIDLAKAKVEKTASSYRQSVILAAVAAGLAFTTLIVLCITIVLSLASLIGPLLGGLLATGLVGGAAAVIGLMAKKSFERADEK